MPPAAVDAMDGSPAGSHGAPAEDNTDITDIEIDAVEEQQDCEQELELTQTVRDGIELLQQRSAAFSQQVEELADEGLRQIEAMKVEFTQRLERYREQVLNRLQQDMESMIATSNSTLACRSGLKLALLQRQHQVLEAVTQNFHVLRQDLFGSGS